MSNFFDDYNASVGELTEVLLRGRNSCSGTDSGSADVIPSEADLVNNLKVFFNADNVRALKWANVRNSGFIDVLIDYVITEIFSCAADGKNETVIMLTGENVSYVPDVAKFLRDCGFSVNENYKVLDEFAPSNFDYPVRYIYVDWIKFEGC